MVNDEWWRDIAIVDATPVDYAELATPAYQLGVTLRSFRTAREALCAAARFRADLWMINVHLPDMPGFDVVEMLRSEQRKGCFFCISDAYVVEEEIRSHLLQAAAYLCKPVQVQWVTAWISQARKIAPRVRATMDAEKTRLVSVTGYRDGPPAGQPGPRPMVCARGSKAFPL
jgi:DNA-binding response OmpR family regulator